MIEAPTVFVLGAGAHCSYGLPTGKQLKEQAAALAGKKRVADDRRSFLWMANLGAATNEEVQQERCEAFAKALAHAGQASIDAFLAVCRT